MYNVTDHPCPNEECKEINWIAERNDDDTYPFADAVRCWSCLTPFFINEDIDSMYGPDTQPEDAILVEGHKSAKDALNG